MPSKAAHTRRVKQDPLDLLRGALGPFQRGPGRKLEMHKQIPLILDGQKARRDALADEAFTDSGGDQNEERDCALVDQNAGPAQVSFGRTIKNAVEPVEEPSQQAGSRHRSASARAASASRA
jgi:hypothetical protein